MNKMRKSIKKIFCLYVVMFSCLIFSIIFILLNSEQKTNSHNPRIRKDDPTVMNGEIRDCNGNTLVETVKENGINKRNYIYNKEFAHIIGYSAMGKTGVESKYHFELTKVRFEIFERIKQILYKTNLKANNIILTLDKDIQHKAYELLGNKKGAIIVTEPSTGKILAMVSYPNFNPNTIENDWNNLNSDIESSPLLNRATQGLYTPGSVFKIITTATAIENMPDWQDFTYECLGEKDFGDKKIKCYNSQKHGIINLQQAFKLSCNTAFATLAETLGSEALKKMYEHLDFNKPIKYPLEYNKSIFTLAEEAEFVRIAIGQGKTLITPLQMARIVSAIANNGTLMQPYIIDHIEDNSGVILKKYKPKKESKFFSNKLNNELVKMMLLEMDNNISILEKTTDILKQETKNILIQETKNISVAGNKGVTEIDGKLPHSWFLGFSPAENPKVSIVVILENFDDKNSNETLINESSSLIKENLNETSINAGSIGVEIIKAVINKQK